MRKHYAFTQNTNFDKPPSNFKSKSSDKRLGQRFTLETDIQIFSQSQGLLPASSLEISEHGIGVIMPADLEIGEIVELQLRLPLGSVRLRAEVKNRNVFRYGLRFVVPNREARVIRQNCRLLPDGNPYDEIAKAKELAQLHLEEDT